MSQRPKSVESYRLTDSMRLALVYMLDPGGIHGRYPLGPGTWRGLETRGLIDVESRLGFTRRTLTGEGRRIARLVKETA